MVRKFRIPLVLFAFCAALNSLQAQEVSVKLIAPDSVFAGEVFEITVQISKGSNTNFARVSLQMPPAFRVDSSVSDNARYLKNGSTVKYLWDRMPSKSELLVKFKITTEPDIYGMKGVNGTFTYIADTAKREITIPTKVIKIQQPEVASVEIKETEPEIQEAEPITEKVETTPPKVKEVDETVTIEAETVIKEEIKQPPVLKETIPFIEFRVQIVASVSKMNIDKLKIKYTINESIRAEMHNGLWKYTVGSYGSYSAAKSELPMYQNEKGVVGAFITAYQGGERISVGNAIKQTK